MTDAELGRALAPDEPPQIQLCLVGALGERRGIYQRLAEVAEEIDLWLAGLAPRPPGVVLNRAPRRRASLKVRR